MLKRRLSRGWLMLRCERPWHESQGKWTGQILLKTSRLWLGDNVPSRRIIFIRMIYLGASAPCQLLLCAISLPYNVNYRFQSLVWQHKNGYEYLRSKCVGGISMFIIVYIPILPTRNILFWRYMDSRVLFIVC